MQGMDVPSPYSQFWRVKATHNIAVFLGHLLKIKKWGRETSPVQNACPECQNALTPNCLPIILTLSKNDFLSSQRRSSGSGS